MPENSYITSVKPLSGYNSVPFEVLPNGTVQFTDGTTVFAPNQLECEAYGYSYDILSGTCSAFRPNINLVASFANENNSTKGAGNSTQRGTNNTIIMGENNTVRGNSRNSIITGSGNEIVNGVNNISVSGVKGEVTTSGSVVLGANNETDTLGKRQSIRLQYGRQTTNNSTVSSYVNNVTGAFFEVPLNSIIYFHADTLVVRTGGFNEAGNVGDYGSYVERGVIISKNGTLSIQRERDTIKTSGTVTGWRILASTSGSNFLLTVRGAANMTLEWTCNVNITQIKPGVTL
tara:strand:+ start:4264 stop:5130 length:867 start_codon:yes stop_codon:yes gene_type:complete